MNPPPVRQISGTLAGLALVFGAGLWTGMRLKTGDSAHVPGTGTPPRPAGIQPRETSAAGRPNSSPLPAVKGAPDLKGLAPREALKGLISIDDSTMRREAALEFLNDLAPEERLSWLERMVDQSNGLFDDSNLAQLALRFAVLDDLIGAVVSSGPLESLNAANTGGTERLLVAAKWAELDPAAAKAWFNGLLSASGPPPQDYKETAEQMAAALARRSPEDGLKWASELPKEGGVRDAALKGAISGAVQTNPREAGRMLNLHAGGVDDAGPLAGRVAAALAGEDLRGALAWASGADERLRRNAIAGALIAGSKQDFPAALSAVGELEGENVLYGLSAVMGKAPPERLPKVAALLEAQPEGKTRAGASGDLMRVWTDKNPEEASAWMKRQPPGPVRDEAISAFVRWADARDPEAALLWANTVSDPERRTETIDHVIGQLGPKAAEALEPWLAANPDLPEAERERILKKIRSAGEETR